MIHVEVRALNVYLDGRITGRIFVSCDGSGPYDYRSAYDHADPRTTRRFEPQPARPRPLPNFLLTAALTAADSDSRTR